MSLQQFFKCTVLIVAITLELTNGMVYCSNGFKDCECMEYNNQIEYYCPNARRPEILKAVYTPDAIEIFCHSHTIDITEYHFIMTDEVNVIKTHNCYLTNNFLNILNEFANKRQLNKILIDGGNVTNVDVDEILNLNVTELDIFNIENFPKLQWNTTRALFLHLANNSIESLPNRLPKSNVIYLELPNNKISKLDDSTFANLDLGGLNLNSNSLNALPPKLLYNLPNLLHISLISNNIHTIPDAFFGKNLKLEKINLNNNHLGDVNKNIFTNLTRLIQLRLGNNTLTTIPNDFFHNLTNLNYLELNINQLKEFPEFITLKNLKSIYLSHNWFEKIERGTFSGMSKLNILDLSHNKISQIDNLAFNDLKMLRTLDLSHNMLKTFSGRYNGLEVFKMEKLEYLLFGRCRRINLSFNNITFIDLAYLRRSTSARQSTILKLTGNPINCNCELYELMKYVKSQTTKYVNKIDINYKEECAKRGVDRTKMEMADFTCKDSNIYQCPKECDCEMHPQTEALKINCSGRGFTKAPIIPSLKEYTNYFNMTIKEIWVNLQNNTIESFTEEERSYKNVNVLNLSHNKLKDIEWLPAKIKALDIEGNEITNMNSVPLLILNQSTALKEIRLHGNRWACDCETILLAEILKTKLMNMTKNSTIVCADGSPLVELDREKACNENTILLIILVTISSLIVILMIILLILYFHYEQHVKIWLYHHKLLFSFVREYDLDKNKIYDAFISYSHKNEDFIAKFLVPKLENGAEKYKLCVHARDWIIGEFIPKQILDSVQNSRRTIIVLSRDFLESEWATMEFTTAHQKSMEEARNRLIVILYEDVDLNEIKNEDLKAYLNTNTYIKWGDPWFWKKLKDALPRKVDEKKSKRKRIKDADNITA